MPRLSILVASILVFSGCHGMQTIEGPPRQKAMPSGIGAHNERAVLRYLWPALNYGQIGGRIYYTVVCTPTKSLDPPFMFPNLDVRPPTKGKVGVAAARDIFRNETDISVKQSATGVIRIRIGDVRDDLLRARIFKVTLPPDDQYTEWAALSTIENAPEVLSAMQELKIEKLPHLIVGENLIEPADGLPHLPPVLKSVTLDDALDLVAKTFGGVVIYEFCTSGDLFDIRFADGYYINSRLYE